jgi:Uma2 family endonuclease
MLEVLEKPGVRAAAMAIDVETYRKMFEGQKTELIQGVVIQKMSKSKLHANAITLLYEHLRKLLPETLRVMKEDPLTIAGSEPEPDLAVVPPIFSLNDEHPTFAHLVVEISVTTQALDADKADMYAKGNIPLYWNILPLEKTTVVYSDPQPKGYASVERLSWNEELILTLPGDTIRINLARVLK